MGGEQVVLRSWMRQRPEESVKAYRYRLNHSCYRCGWECADMAKLNAHEDRQNCSQRS